MTQGRNGGKRWREKTMAGTKPLTANNPPNPIKTQKHKQNTKTQKHKNTTHLYSATPPPHIASSPPRAPSAPPPPPTPLPPHSTPPPRESLTPSPHAIVAGVATNAPPLADLRHTHPTHPTKYNIPHHQGVTLTERHRNPHVQKRFIRQKSLARP